MAEYPAPLGLELAVWAKNDSVLVLADWALFLFHTALVAFNSAGWIWRRTRKWHLATLGATALSWSLLGLWFGAGYCICTDIHWKVRRQLGQSVTEDNYIQFLVQRLTGWLPDASLTSKAALAVFLTVSALSIALNLRDWRLARHLHRSPVQ